MKLDGDFIIEFRPFPGKLISAQQKAAVRGRSEIFDFHLLACQINDGVILLDSGMAVKEIRGAMSSVSENCCQCPSPTSVVAIPGSPGENGVDGINAFTLTAASFLIPAVGMTVVVTVEDSSWATIGQDVAVEGAGDSGRAGIFLVTAKPSDTQMTLQYEDYYVNTESGSSIASGSQVSPAGVQSPLAAGLPSAILIEDGGEQVSPIQDTLAIYNLTIPHTFASGTSAGEVVTEIFLGHKFRIIDWKFVTDVPGVGASASRVFNMEINSTNVGTIASTITATEASTSSKGEVTLGTAVSGANEGAATDTFSIEVAAGGTQFTAGSGCFIVSVQNLDTFDGMTSFVEKFNDLLDALS